VVSLLIEALFVLVFVRALVAYVIRRDPLQRDLMLVFSAMAVLTVIEVVRHFVPHPPTVLTVGSSVLLLAQPYLTMRLVAQLRPVPRWLMLTSFASWLVSSVLLVGYRDRASQPELLFIVGSFMVFEAVAGVYFLAGARSRTGAPRARFLCAGLGTLLFAVALGVAGTASALPREVHVVRAWSLVLAVVSGMGYLLAFVPPRRLRATWSAVTAVAVGRELLDARPSELPEETWRRYAGLVGGITGSDAVLVLLADADEAKPVAGYGVDELPPTCCPVSKLDELVRRRQPVLFAEFGDGVGCTVMRNQIPTRFVTAVPLDAREERGALVLFHRYRVLFDDDDIRLLGELGAQAAILAERSSDRQTQVRLAADLSASVRALSAANQAKTDFLAAMSHELRTPLNAIIGFSELMRGEQPDGDRRRVPAEWIEHVYGSGRHLLGLINDVLDLAKVESGRVDLDIEELDLPPVLEETVAALRPLADRKHLVLTVGAPPSSICADPTRLRQILNNLLSNAIKFTPEGGSVSVEAYRDGDEVAIAVTDTGVGIAPADQHRVFEEFQQVGDVAARQAGTGLGLALTRQLVHAHGGRVELVSDLGRGSRFTVYLPASLDARASGTDQALLAVPVPGRSTVLVIEDDPGAQHLLRTYLSGAGYHVLAAPSGEEGLALARQVRPSAIVLDVLLPGMDGWEVLRRLKEDPELGEVPVFMATVLDEPDPAMAQTADDYFVKPIDRHRLLARLAERVLPNPGHSATALAIDPDREGLALIEDALRERGYEVIATTSGEEGVKLARAEPVDLIVSHLPLPEFEGIGLLRDLNGPATRAIPVLVVTGDPQELGWHR
jgi:signal transduction histidine kinase/CheY-like chemotaxis protein